jgi:hypothetical protein
MWRGASSGNQARSSRGSCRTPQGDGERAPRALGSAADSARICPGSGSLGAPGGGRAGTSRRRERRSPASRARREPVADEAGGGSLSARHQCGYRPYQISCEVPKYNAVVYARVQGVSGVRSSGGAGRFRVAGVVGRRMATVSGRPGGCLAAWRALVLPWGDAPQPCRIAPPAGRRSQC